MPERPEAPYPLRSYIGAINGTVGGQDFTDGDYRVADGIFNDIPGLFHALAAAGVIEPSGWSADRSVVSWHVKLEFWPVHVHDLRWNPDGHVACIGKECALHFNPGDVDRTEYFETWPKYTGPIPS
jgi:hypothetical protein